MKIKKSIDIVTLPVSVFFGGVENDDDGNEK